MATVTPIDYQQDYYQLQPSLFRESDNLHLLLQAIHDVFDLQQLDFLWLSENLLNIDVAEKSHLDFIGNLVGQSRFLIGFDSDTYFGFEGAYESDTFGALGAPYIGGVWNSRSYFNVGASRRLSDEEYRRVIKARVIFNSSNCSANDLLEVINLLTGRNDNSTQIRQHGLIRIKSLDTTGILSYFIDKIDSTDNILPVVAGVRVVLEYIEGQDYFGDDMVEFLNLLEKLANEDLPKAYRVLTPTPPPTP